MKNIKPFKQFLLENLKTATVGRTATNDYQKKEQEWLKWAIEQGLKNTYGKNMSKGKEVAPKSAIGKLAIYVVTQEKENPYTKNDWFQTIPANTIIAVCDGKKPLYLHREPMAGPPYESEVTLTPERRTNHDNHNIGYHDHESGKYATGVRNMKRIIELADVAYVF